jgi:D-erythronate 2-dehydrogenase
MFDKPRPTPDQSPRRTDNCGGGGVYARPMRIAVLGAAGMLGRRLVERLAKPGALGSARPSHMLLVDVVAPATASAGDIPAEALVADVAEPGVAERVVAGRPEVIFDLAAVVSGEAEADLAKGYRVNVDAARLLFDAIHDAGQGYRPRLVFSSSIAVFGPPVPDLIGDGQPPTPATSYGTQKAMVEFMLGDYTRRGVLDGVAIRLPTICVRPGTPNLAASGFFSNIIREPLNGKAAILPVSEDVRHWFASPRSGVEFLIHAATLPSARLGRRRSLNMPGVSATVAMEIDALRRVGGERAVGLIERIPDDTIARIVAGWPRAFDARRARVLGFRAEPNFCEIVRVYIDDELDGRVPGSTSP